jgi:ABC-type branched-subunit amino acid transport system ATPase component
VSGDTRAPAGVAPSADAGAVFALPGPNGAGNTTLVGISTKGRAPDAGSARLAGFDVVHDAAAARSAIGLRQRFVAIGSLANGLVDKAQSVVLPVRMKRTDHHHATSKSRDSSQTPGKR